MNKAKALLMAMLVFPAGPAVRLIDHENDDPDVLVPGGHMEMNLKSLDQRSRRSVPQVAAPWSDVGWKANKGLITERFADSRFEAAAGWSAKHDFLRSYSTRWILQQPGYDRERWIAALSPAEKYDLLMGTVKGGLAENIGAFLDHSLGNSRQFPGWWGLCEGAAASTMYYPEPVRLVVLHSQSYDLDVPFFAPDIKGLATMLWSRFNTELNLPESGLPCKKDGTGCFDSNPASFHASVHHFLDLSPGILVGDMDPTPVVWNFPIVAYSEAYYRPDKKADVTAADLRSAALKPDDWGSDPRKSKRSPGTAYIVGIKMKISYAVNQEEKPPFEGSLKRKVNSRVLVYELELDSDWKLLGGEWVSGEHPDLLWSIPRDVVPDSIGDKSLAPDDTWHGEIPKSWTEAARISAAKLTPLRRVVELLVKKSSD